MVTFVLAIAFGWIYGWASAFGQHPLEKPTVLNNPLVPIAAALAPIILVVLTSIREGFIWSGLILAILIVVIAFISNFRIQHGINKRYREATQRTKAQS